MAARVLEELVREGLGQLILSWDSHVHSLSLSVRSSQIVIGCVEWCVGETAGQDRAAARTVAVDLKSPSSTSNRHQDVVRICNDL